MTQKGNEKELYLKSIVPPTAFKIRIFTTELIPGYSRSIATLLSKEDLVNGYIAQSVGALKNQ
jgi:hypothetical protein